jgi:hypothetical protein
MSLENFDIRHSINGDQVIGFGSVADIKTAGFIDKAKASAYFMDDSDYAKKRLGLIHLFAGASEETMPFMKDIFSKAAVLEVEEGQTLTYDLPVKNADALCYTLEDTSTKYGEAPGIDESIFELVLNREYTKNDILTYDFLRGAQVMVSPSHDVEAVGEGYRHYVVLSGVDKGASFPQEYLKAGVQWFKVTNLMGEYDEDYSTVQLGQNPSAYITNEFVLGDVSGVSAFYTRKANAMKSPGLSALTDSMHANVMKQLDTMKGGENSMFFMADRVGGNIRKSSIKIGSTLEYLVMLEMQKMEVAKVLFAKAGTFRSGNGSKMINEGIWHQIQRGKTIEFAHTITLSHLQEASNYVFRGRGNQDPTKRRIKFKAGWNAYNNVMEIFRESAIQQANQIPSVLLGTDKQIQGTLFSGSLDNLSMGVVKITSAVLPGIGFVEVEHDPSLDYRPFADRRTTGFNGEGLADTSWSLTIWDAMDSEYTNINDFNVKGAKLADGANGKNNMFYVKPTDGGLVYGFEQGRMANGDQNYNVQSSMKKMGREFWAVNQSAGLILDISRYVTIQRKQK